MIPRQWRDAETAVGGPFVSISRHLVDTDLLAALDTRPQRRMTIDALPAIRAELSTALFPPENCSSEGVIVGELHVRAEAGSPDVRILTYTPVDACRPMPAILHIHGGGFVVGCPEMVAPDDLRVARELGAVVCSVAYRLAPETPYPGPLEDCYAALRGIHDNARALGIDTSRIAVAGESAGGGLAAALALLARDRGEFGLAFMSLVFPMLDDRVDACGSRNRYTGEFFWTRENNAFGWNAMKGALSGSEDIPAYLAPARATDLAGLPATFMYTGGLDLFLEENLDFAHGLMRAGVPTEFHVYPGAYHGFQLVAGARVAQAADRDRLAALRRALQ